MVGVTDCNACIESLIERHLAHVRNNEQKSRAASLAVAILDSQWPFSRGL